MAMLVLTMPDPTIVKSGQSSNVPGSRDRVEERAGLSSSSSARRRLAAAGNCTGSSSGRRKGKRASKTGAITRDLPTTGSSPIAALPDTDFHPLSAAVEERWCGVFREKAKQRWG
jgi:hypothetical protein